MAHAGKGGLQAHSIGEDYPYTVVGTIAEEGIALGFWHTEYYVANLVTGKRDTRRFYSCRLAHAWCRHLREENALA